jgi:putative hydrolase of the HAD superfamily
VTPRLDHLTTIDELNRQDARRIAAALVERHTHAKVADLRIPDIGMLARAHSMKVAQIARDIPELATEELRIAASRQTDLLQEQQNELVGRIDAGRIRASVVSLGIDAISLEPNSDVHIETQQEGEPGDVCIELAGLSVGLSAADRADTAEALIADYADCTGDFGLYEFVNYYEFSTALARAAEAAEGVAKARDHESREAAIAAARRFVAIALASDRRKDRPQLVLAVGGLVASGKSTLAGALADHMNIPIVIADHVRDQLLHGAPGRLVHESHWTKNFEPGFQERVYVESLRRAERVLSSGRAVVLDGCFAHARDRIAAQQLARRARIPFRFIELRISDEVQRERIAKRNEVDRQGGWQEIAKTLASDWEPASELREDEFQVLDGNRPLAENVSKVVSKLPGRPDPEPPGAPEPWPHSMFRDPPAAITFDCWNTLIYEADWELAHGRRVEALATAAEEAGRETTISEAGAAFDVGWAHQMACWRDGINAGAREVAIHALRELGLLEPHPALEHLIREYEEASHSSQVLAIEGARECLAKLEREGIRRALICDTGLTPGRVVRQHLDRLGLLGHLDVCIFSDEIGVPKPNARVFRAALDPLGVEPERAIHVGDLRRTDVAGARASGMGTVRIRCLYDDTSVLPDADSVADSHLELLAILLRPASTVATSTFGTADAAD